MAVHEQLPGAEQHGEGRRARRLCQPLHPGSQGAAQGDRNRHAPLRLPGGRPREIGAKLRRAEGAPPAIRERVDPLPNDYVGAAGGARVHLLLHVLCERHVHRSCGGRRREALRAAAGGVVAQDGVADEDQGVRVADDVVGDEKEVRARLRGRAVDIVIRRLNKEEAQQHL